MGGMALASTGKPYVACVTKLGVAPVNGDRTKVRLGWDVIVELRSALGPKPYVAVHSETAARNIQLRQRFEKELGVALFVTPETEGELMASLMVVAHEAGASSGVLF